MLFSKKSDPIALDIGSTFIKLVQLKGAKGHYQLVKFGMIPLPPECRLAATSKDSSPCAARYSPPPPTPPAECSASSDSSAPTG